MKMRKRWFNSLLVFVMFFSIVLPSMGNTQTKSRVITDSTWSGVIPELHFPSNTNSHLPDDTYNNRTIYKGLDPEDFVPVLLTVNNRDYYESQLAGEPLTKLNDKLDEWDPNLDTFIGIYRTTPDTIVHEFASGVSNITLMMNKDSYFARGVTVEVEEWLEKNAGSRTAAQDTFSYSVSYGLTKGQQQDVSLTTGFKGSNTTTLGFELDGLSASTSFTFEISQSESTSTGWSRNITTSDSQTRSATFGRNIPHLYGEYDWGVYQLQSRLKMNYTTSGTFHELDDVFLNDINWLGLVLKKKSYVENIAFDNLVYGRNEEVSVVPQQFVEEQLAVAFGENHAEPIEIPSGITVTALTNDGSVEIGWNEVDDGRVSGYYILKDGEVLTRISGKNETSWQDYGIKPNKESEYQVASYIEIDQTYGSNTVQHNKMDLVSDLSDEVSVILPINSIHLNEPDMNSCSFTFTWEDNGAAFGERVYYQLWHENPTNGSTYMIGKFEGDQVSFNLSPELRDKLSLGSNNKFFVVKEVLYNGESLESQPSNIVNENISFEDGVYLYSKKDYKGNCVRVDSGNYDNITDVGMSNNVLSSVMMVGDYLTHLYRDTGLNNDLDDNVNQTFFSDVPNLGDKDIGNDKVSSLKVREKEDGIYLFRGKNYKGGYNRVQTSSSYTEYDQMSDVNFPNNELSSLKIVGNYGAILYDHADFVEGYDVCYPGCTYQEQNSVSAFKSGTKDLSDFLVGNNAASSMKVLKGKGVHLFTNDNWRKTNAKAGIGNYNNIDDDLPFPNDKLSAIVLIGDVTVELYQHNNYEGRKSTFTSHDRFLIDNNIGDNSTSSLKVYETPGDETHNDDDQYENKGVEVLNVPNDLQLLDSPNDFSFSSWYNGGVEIQDIDGVVATSEGSYPFQELTPTNMNSSIYQNLSLNPKDKTYTFGIWLRADEPHKANIKVQNADFSESNGVKVDVTTEWQYFEVSQEFTERSDKVTVVVWPGGYNETTNSVYAFGASLIEN
ncbi:hypothetical protein [Chengkuizengella axinellae]|uniref:Beta/gamma crystallin 'Greek key' domain-containing protein n=1 Tax=Chengkuizengella axinellae TaxID=3064388 RepID=A0ABT9IX18_9BACL|nr:hypothetical protein [Chengkuizengella sp. 2205SS18-9]MDP5273906.1 hypothetical protein [Chengkuizengella sp. 2205SS18-9]